jgi:hypothetical protein
MLIYCKSQAQLPRSKTAPHLTDTRTHTDTKQPVDANKLQLRGYRPLNQELPNMRWIGAEDVSSLISWFTVNQRLKFEAPKVVEHCRDRERQK